MARTRSFFRRLWPLLDLYQQNGVPENMFYTLNAFTLGPMLGSIGAAFTTGGPVLVGYAKLLGLNNFMFGLINAVPVAAVCVSFFASWLVERTRDRKAMQLWTFFPARSIWFIIALLPYIIPVQAGALRIWMFIILYTAISMLSQCGGTAGTTWYADIVPIPIRGRYISLRSSLTNVAAMAFSLVVSAILDAMHNTMTAYTICFLIGAVFGLGDIVFYIKAKDVPMKPLGTSYAKGVLNALRNKGFLLFTVFWTLWSFGWNLSMPFYGRYALGPLNLSFTQYTVAAVVTYSLMMAIMAPRWGRLVDRHGRNWVFKRTLWAVSLASFLWIFARPGSLWVLFAYNILVGMTMCGVEVVTTQFTFNAFPAKSRSVYIAIFSTTTALAGNVLGNLLGGRLLDILGNAVLPLGFVTLDNYQMLIIAAALIRLLVTTAFLGAVFHIRDAEDADAVVIE